MVSGDMSAEQLILGRTREVPWLEVVEQSSYVADLSDISSIYKQGSRRVTWAGQEWPHSRKIQFTVDEVALCKQSSTRVRHPVRHPR